MKIEDLVRKSVECGRSGAIEIYSIQGGNESSLSWESFKEALRALSAPDSLRTNLDRGCVFPSTQPEWAWLENASLNPKFRFKINTQLAYAADVHFNETFSDGSSAIELRNQHDTKKQQARVESERLDAGYGKSRMGGWVEM